MRIAQVVTYISADGAFGGPVAVAVAQCVELARQGHEVDLYAAWDGIAAVEAPGVNLRLFKVSRGTHRSLTAIFSLALVRTLRRERRHYDVFHLHFGRDATSMSAWSVLSRRQSNVVLQPHGMITPDTRAAVRFLDGLIVKRALRGARVVLSLTDRETQGLTAIAGPSASIHRIDNGVPFSSDVTFDRPSNPDVVLFLARLHPRKNVMRFAEAARLARDAGLEARFRVVGPDEGDLPALESFVQQYDLQGYLEYGGSVGPGGSRRELAAAAVYVLPSEREVYPMTVLEAIAAGTPVVLSRDCGLSPELERASAAVVTEPKPHLLLDAVTKLLHDPESRRSLADRALSFGSSHYSIEAVVESLIKIYEDDSTSVRSERAPRVAIIQPYVPEYRVALWSSVIEELAEKGIEAKVFWGASRHTLDAISVRGDLTTPTWSVRVPAFELRWSRHFPPVVFRRLPAGWRRPAVLLTEMQVTNANAWVAALRSIQIVTMGHGASGTTTQSQLSNLLESRQNRLAKHVLTYTPEGRNTVKTLTGLPLERITSFDNATDTDRLRLALKGVTRTDFDHFAAAHGVSANAKIALYVGALEPYKRIDLLVAAAEQVFRSDPDWHLVVAGDGSERPLVERLAAESGRVTILGRVGQDGFAVPARHASLIVNPGRIGLLAVDALTIGVPILTTATAQHAPEYSYLQPDEDVVTAGDTAEEFARTWAAFSEQSDKSDRDVPSAKRSASIIAGVLLSVARGGRCIR